MPSALNTQKLEEIKTDLEDVVAVWVVDYRGLTVKESQELRRSIREADASLKVYKNTLVKIALNDMELPNMDEVLAGPSAFVFAKGDPVASAKALKDFAKDHKALEIKGGMMDNRFVDAESVVKIANLPSREQLIAQLLGTIQNPMSGLVRVLNGPMEAFARCVNQIAEQKPAA